MNPEVVSGDEKGRLSHVGPNLETQGRGSPFNPSFRAFARQCSLFEKGTQSGTSL